MVSDEVLTDQMEDGRKDCIGKWLCHTYFLLCSLVFLLCFSPANSLFH
jgi:hypothetical protein